MAENLPDYAINNRAWWTRSNAMHTDGQAHEAWAQSEITWGVWKTPESELNVLPDVRGKDVIELGCGTAYFGAWLKKRGARRLVGIDVTPAQLDTARRMDAEFGLGLELIQGDAEAVPLPDASFDLAISEYGASIWCDSTRWIPEAARLLRTDGELIFMRGTDIEHVCSPDEPKIAEGLVRSLNGMHRMDWTEEDGSTTSEFHLPTAELFQLLRRSGFAVIDFRQIFAREESVDHPFYTYVPVEWARRWPSEEIWRARKR